MKVISALIWREFLEHKGAFFIAPATILSILFILLLLAFGFGDGDADVFTSDKLSGTQIYEMALAGGFALWMAYLMIALFFYFADSFSADRRNNSLLFWKSMPQTDFTILGAKALTGITLFPALIFGFAMIMGVLIYLVSFVFALKLPIPLIGPVDMLGAWLLSGLSGAVAIVLSLIWYAPFLAWVAGLSTLVRRWSIPLAFLIPGVLVIVESIMLFGQRGVAHPIADYLSYRSDGVFDEADVVHIIMSGDIGAPLQLIGTMLARFDWPQAMLGLAVSVLLVYLASEYRRRRIEA